MPAPKKDAYHHGDLREALLRASLALIEEGGVQALSLRKAARKAGVSSAAPYHHFANRTELLVAIATEGFDILGAMMEEGGAATSLGDCGKAYVHFAREHTAHFRVMFRPELAQPDAFPDGTRPGQEVFRRLVDRVSAAQADGSAPVGDAEELIVLAWSVAHGLSALLVDGPLSCGVTDKISLDLDTLGDVVVETFSRILRAAAKAPRPRR